MDDPAENAMTEIALALAMAFFSVMVLAMISMGAGEAEPVTSPRVAVASLAPAAAASDTTARTVGPDDQLVVHYQGRFYDGAARPLDPTVLDPGRPAILAIEPTLGLAEALAVRARIAVPDTTVTALDERWTQALRRKTDEAR